MKSVNVISKLGALSFIGLMVLTLATGGTALAADNFKLFQQVKVSEKPAELKRLASFEDADTKLSGVASSEKWLGAEPNFQKFASTFSTEPFRFVEGIKAAMLKSTDLEKFRADTKAGFDKLDSKAFGGFIRMNAFKTLL